MNTKIIMNFEIPFMIPHPSNVINYKFKLSIISILYQDIRNQFKLTSFMFWTIWMVKKELGFNPNSRKLVIR